MKRAMRKVLTSACRIARYIRIFAINMFTHIVGMIWVDRERGSWRLFL